MQKYWFKPARFWKWFASYYPVSWQGWVVTIALLAAAIKIFWLIDHQSHSVSDTLLNYAPWFIVLALLFDLACFRKGEYPS
jgi:hypothetical protein